MLFWALLFWALENGHGHVLTYIPNQLGCYNAWEEFLFCGEAGNWLLPALWGSFMIRIVLPCLDEYLLLAAPYLCCQAIMDSHVLLWTKEQISSNLTFFVICMLTTGAINEQAGSQEEIVFSQAGLVPGPGTVQFFIPEIGCLSLWSWLVLALGGGWGVFLVPIATWSLCCVTTLFPTYSSELFRFSSGSFSVGLIPCVWP